MTPVEVTEITHIFGKVEARAGSPPFFVFRHLGKISLFQMLFTGHGILRVSSGFPYRFRVLFLLPFEITTDLIIAAVQLAGVPVTVVQQLTVRPWFGLPWRAPAQHRRLVLLLLDFHHRHHLGRWRRGRASGQKKQTQAEE